MFQPFEDSCFFVVLLMVSRSIAYLVFKRCKNQTKMKFLLQGSKIQNCLSFYSQVDPSKTRKIVYFFSSNMSLFSRKTNFSLSPSRMDGSGHKRSKIEHLRSLRISKILRLGKSNQRVLFYRLFVFCEM